MLGSFCILTFKKELHQLFLFFSNSIVCIVLIGVFNYFIDPYGDNRLYVYEGINKHKATIDERILKFENLLREDYEAYVFGSSVTTVIEPREIQKRTGLKAYNASFSSATSEEYYKFIKYLVENNKKLKKIIIGIDLFAYSTEFKSNGQMPAEFKSIDYGNELKRYLSFESLRRSVEVIIFNSNNSKPDITFSQDGIRKYNTYLNAKKRGGDTFSKYIERSVINGDHKWHKIGDLSKTRLDYLKRIKLITSNNNVELVLFSNPIYHQYLEDSSQKEYKLLKQLISYIDHKISPIKDFSFKFELNKDPFNFIDKSHYSYETSRVLLDRLLLSPRANTIEASKY